ncbi:Uncharacterized protein ACS0PU_003690 [Formica fusca]
MAEEERVPLSEKDDTQSNDTTQSKDAYVPEEPTPDTSICLSDIQMPETPESTKGQISDGDTSRLESPKTLKPVLGKIQAKKRLMAFANQFKVLSKSQIKSNLQHSTGAFKMKDKTVHDDTNINKSRKKTEEKILAIEEIRREESKSKMLAMASMAAASMENENHTGKNTSDLLASKRHAKVKSRHEGINDSRKSRSTINRKYSERHRHRDKTDRSSSNREVKDRNESTEHSVQKSSQDREIRKKDKKRKDDKDRRDDSKMDTSRDKREEEKDRKENEKEKREETREKRDGTKSKKENIKDKRNDILEMEAEDKDKKEKDKDRWKEKELLKCNSWVELQKSGLTLDDISHLRRRDNTERFVRNRTAQDYARYLEHMLMLNNYHLKRQALIAEGLDGPKKYPPESIKTTKRAKGAQLLYCENPRTSLFLCISQLLQAVSPERREKIRDICEASSSRFDTEDTEPQKRNWYQQINATKYHQDTKCQVTVQLPRSKWDSEDEEMTVSATKEEIKKPINKLHISVAQQERCSTSSSTTNEDKIDNKAEDTKGDNESNEKKIDNTTINDEASTSPLPQSTGDEKLASEYEQFMKMVCTVTDVTKEYLPKKNPVKTTSPHSYHEFNIESNLAEDNTDIEISLKEKKDKLQTLEGSIKSTECEESIISTDCQIQIDEDNMQIRHTNSNESEDSKSIPSDWENVRIKVERLSDENTESREIKKKKKQKKVISSSDSSSSTSSSDSEKEKKRKKRKRKILNNSSSDSDSTDSSSTSSSDSSSSDEKRKRKRKKKTIGKKRKKARRAARTKKKRRRKMSTDSSSSDSDERTKKKKKIKKKIKEAKSINNGDISKIISKSPVIDSPSDETKVLHSGTSIKKTKEEATIKDKKRTDQITSTRKTITGMSVHDNESMKQWEVDSVITLQPTDSESSQDHIDELEKIDGSEKSTYRKKRKRSRDNVQDKDRSSKINEERIHEGKERSDEELEMKRKKKREKDVRSSTEFLADWEREGERINQQIIQNEVKFSKKLEKKHKKEKWGETYFDTLNVPSLTQLEKEVCQKQLLADEWEVDSLEAIAIADLTVNKRKSSQNVSKKMEKEVRYDEKTDTYIAIEKESAKEMKKRQERLCAIRIWEEEQEEGEKEELMLLKQKNKHKKDDWDIEEESFLCKNNEEICKVNDIVGIEKEWIKPNEDTSVKEDSSKLEIKLESIGSKRVRKSRWDMGSHSEEKSETKDIWEEEYPEWSKINKCEQKNEETEKGDSRAATYSESSDKSDLIDFYHKKSQNRESLERAWTSEEMATKPIQMKKVEDTSVKNLISAKTNDEQIASTKEHQTRNQFKDILDLNAKFKDETIELYSPSSPALSQKSQDIEGSNDSSSSTSLPCKKRRKEMLVATEELSIPIAGIPLQLTKLRDTKHEANEKIEDILDKVQLEDKNSAHKFDIKKTDDLFDDLSMNELCPKAHNSQSVCMDIFAEYRSEGSHSKQRIINSNVNSATHTKDDETNAEKTALKLIPKQLLIRRTNEQVKPMKRILEAPLQDPVQHAAALLTIQKKLLESHVLQNDIQKSPNEEPADQFKSTYNAENNSKIDKLLDTTEFAVASKSSVIAIRQSPASEKAISVRPGQSENYDNRESKDDVKKYKTSRNLSDINIPSGIRSPVREHRKKSPGKKESEKRYSHDYSKDKKERRSDDGEKSDRRDNKSFRTDFADGRRKSSPSGRGKRKRSGSPYASWERQGSGSRSPGHSWSRSRSRSPKRKDEATTSMRDRDKRRERYDDERSNRSRTDERRERYMRFSPRSYNEDNFKKHGSVSSKGNREDWGRRRYDSVDVDREKDVRSYDPMELLRERTMESEKYRDNRFHTEELDHTYWQYENSNILRDGNESVDSYAAGQDLPAEYDDRTYYREESLERDMIQCSPQPLSKYRRSQGRSSTRRDWQWEKDKGSISDLDRHGHRLRNRTPPRSRYSPKRQERFRRKSKSRSRSWSQSRSRTRSRSRSRSTSRSRPRMRSRSRSRSRSPSDLRSRARSISMSRLRSPERGLRMSELRSSRSPSPGRSRLNEIERERKDEDKNRKLNVCGEKGRRIETIVQSGVASGTNILDSEMGISGNMDATNFQYLNEIEGGNEYYYTENNLTYPPCIDESTTSSPKRLSLDDRLELELGIKKQHSKDSTGISSDYSSNFNPNVIAYPSPPQQQQQQMMYRQQPTVLQVGNVLQVVPADFNGMQSSRREVSAACTTPPVRPGSSQVVRVGNVLQVVPTSLDWSGQSTTADQSNGLLYSSTVPAPSPSASSVPMSVPVPVPVPLPVPPTGTNTLAPVVTVAPVAPLQLPLPIPVPVPVPIPPATTTAFPRNEIQSQKVVQPVYNYEAILETRRKEREERKRLRELRRKEKERKKIERINRRALRLLEKTNTSQPAGEVLLDRRKGSVVDPSVLKALKEGEEQAETESPSQTNSIKEEEEEAAAAVAAAASIKEEDEDAAADEDEDDDEDEIEAEAEDDEEEEEEAEDEDEDDNDDDEKSSQMINQRIEVDEATMPADMNKDQAEIETTKEWLELPLPPLKGILIAPGFRRDSIPNGNLDDLSDVDDDIKDNSDKDEETDKNNDCNKDTGPDAKSGKSAKLLKKTNRNKKSVQFADGIKPGEGTSPSGGEGDMPSPPPPKRIDLREGLKDLRRDKIYNSRKSRKQEKRARLPKTKKKVKVKIIKLKKPRVTPLTAMMMDDSDEMDDRSPPPPPPGSPPPPHLWPSYLSVYNTTVRTVEQLQTITPTLTSVQTPPPPTPLPLLVPPPPLNYTIQPCSKA